MTDFKLTHKAYNAEVELFNYTYNVVFSDTIIDGLRHVDLLDTFKLVSGHTDETLPTTAQGMFTSLPENIKILTLLWDSSINTITHECFHLICDLMRGITIPLNKSTEEVFAYTLGYVVEQVLGMQKQIKR